VGRHSLSSLPDNWRNKFKYLIRYPAPGKEQDWLKQFLANPDAERAFKILGWVNLDATFIYRVCKAAYFQSIKADNILHDADRMKEAQKKARDLERYIVAVERHSSEAGEFFGTLYDVIISDIAARGIRFKVGKKILLPEVIPTLLRSIKENLPRHIRKSRRGAESDRQVEQLLVLVPFFRQQYGQPYFDAVALLHNATFLKKRKKTSRQIKEQYERLGHRWKRGSISIK